MRVRKRGRLTTTNERLARQRNALRSTGPRTEEGKAIAARNALKHGLAIPITRDPQSAERIQLLAWRLSAGTTDETVLLAARQAAEAWFELQRVRAVRARLLTDPIVTVVIRERTVHEISARVEAFYLSGDLTEEGYDEAMSPTETRRIVEPFAGFELCRLHHRTLTRLERYERRAHSRWLKALVHLMPGRG
jgi:hypothetical protein